MLLSTPLSNFQTSLLYTHHLCPLQSSLPVTTSVSSFLTILIHAHATRLPQAPPSLLAPPLWTLSVLSPHQAAATPPAPWLSHSVRADKTTLQAANWTGGYPSTLGSSLFSPLCQSIYLHLKALSFNPKFTFPSQTPKSSFLSSLPPLDLPTHPPPCSLVLNDF